MTNTSVFNFISAINRAADSPCDRFSCRNRSLCASKLLACTAFRYYVSTGKAINPCLDVPVRITKIQKPVLMDAPLPTSAIYESIHNDDDGTTKPEKDKEARKAIVDEIVDKAMRARSDLERLVLR